MPHDTDNRGEPYTIRPLQSEETHLLKDFLYLSIFVPEGSPLPPRDILDKPELLVYTRDFGAGEADNALAAAVNEKPVGIVWARIMNDYGHVDDSTPSLAIALMEEYRGRGIGAMLLQKMLERLKAQGYSRASLSVQKANRAAGLYRSLGFAPVRENAEEFIMVRDLRE